MHLSPKERFGYVILGTIVIVGAGFVIGHRLHQPAKIELHETSFTPSPEKAELNQIRQTGPRIVVHVAGAVKYPGIVSIPAGARIYDAVVQAGGPTSDANIDAINLAAKAIDGTQILVPSRGSAIEPGISNPVPTRITTGKKQPPSIVDINSASSDQLMSLPGIGQTWAQRIVDYRSQHGPFQAIEDILAIPGFGKKRLEQIRTWVVVQ